jgi:predicted membrane-bound spermidine synthase
MRHRYWFVFFLVSGFCSLLYQVVWLRLAMASFGVTTPLVSIVLSTFMGGLALGSWGAGVLMNRLADRPAALGLRFYAAVEGTTAVWAMLVPLALHWGRDALAGGGWGSTGYYAGSAAFVVLALLPACTCMGATVPLGLFVLRKTWGEGAAQGFSYLYLANVVGAALGTVITAFVLVELVGFSGAVAAGAIGNAAIAVMALALGRAPASGRASAPGPTEPAPPAAAPPSAFPSAAPALSALFVTGLVSMGMEVVWIRLLTPYLGSLVYCFASILFLYLVATVAGAWLYRLVRRRGGLLRGVPPWAWAVVGVAGLLPLAASDPSLALGPIYHHSFEYAVGRSLLRSVLAVVPFAGALGFLTPMVTDAWSGGDPKRAGAAYGLNIVGCILGPLLSGFVLLPLLGERVALLVLSLPLLLGTLLPVVGGAGAGRSLWGRLVAASTGAAAAALIVTLTRGSEWTYGERAVVRRDETATVVATGKARSRGLLVNGIGMTHMTPVTKMMAHLPMAFRKTPPRRTLVVCFGMGTSFRSAFSWGGDTVSVELIRSVPGLFGFFHADGDEILRSPRARVVVDDGRRFLERSTETFDVIVIDPAPPLEAAGSSLLYSREFHEVARRRLSADGILQQWLPRGGPRVSSAILKAVSASFPYVRTFTSIEGWGLHILASGQPIASARASVLAARLPPEAVPDLLEWGPRQTAEEQFAAVLEREVAVDALIARDPEAPVLVDDRPLNEYFVVRREIEAWRRGRVPPP